jgi:hypothetical protein
MDIRSLSGIGRPLDFGHATNRWIVGGSAAVLVTAGLVLGIASEQWVASWSDALRLALAVFLAWAICRELDPDHEMAALGAAGLCAAALAMGLSLTWPTPLPLPGIAECFALLLAMRVVNRTTGAPATLADALAVLGLGIWLADAGSDWVYLAAGAAALVLDGMLPPRSLRSVATAALLSLLALVVAVFVARTFTGAGPLPVGLPHPAALLPALVLLMLFVVVIRDAGTLHSIGDDTGLPLHPSRVRTGQMLSAAVGAAAVATRGFEGLLLLLPLWSAIAVAGGDRLLRRRGKMSS